MVLNPNGTGFGTKKGKNRLPLVQVVVELEDGEQTGEFYDFCVGFHWGLRELKIFVVRVLIFGKEVKLNLVLVKILFRLLKLRSINIVDIENLKTKLLNYNKK